MAAVVLPLPGPVLIKISPRLESVKASIHSLREILVVLAQEYKV